MEDMEGEGMTKKTEKSISSSVSYARKLSITITGQVRIRNITVIV